MSGDEIVEDEVHVPTRILLMLRTSLADNP
jgi:hypothetical protein